MRQGRSLGHKPRPGRRPLDLSDLSRLHSDQEAATGTKWRAPPEGKISELLCGRWLRLRAQIVEIVRVICPRNLWSSDSSGGKVRTINQMVARVVAPASWRLPANWLRQRIWRSGGGGGGGGRELTPGRWRHPVQLHHFTLLLTPLAR